MKDTLLKNCREYLNGIKRMNGSYTDSQRAILMDFIETKADDIQRDFDIVHAVNSVTRCKVKEGYETAGRRGDLLRTIFTAGRLWAVVLWNDQVEPDIFKAEGLLVHEAEVLSRWTDIV